MGDFNFEFIKTTKTAFCNQYEFISFEQSP